MITKPLLLTGTISARVRSLSPIFILPNILLFSTSSSSHRPFHIWEALASKAGFSASEVLDAAQLGAFVVVDPMNKSSLLALSPAAYQRLLGQVISREDSTLVLLFSPFDERQPTVSNGTSERPSQNSPPHYINIATTVDHLYQEEKAGRFSTRFTPYSKGFQFHYFQGTGVSSVDGRLSFATPAILAVVYQKWASSLLFWLRLSRGRVTRTGVYMFINHLVKISQAQGMYGLALYLKASYNVVCRFLAGDKVKNTFVTFGVPVKLANGLPAWLPAGWRQYIRRSSETYIKFVLSLLYTYKSIHAPKKEATDVLTNITLSPLKPLSPLDPFRNFVHDFLKARVKPIDPRDLYPREGLPLSLKAGPSCAIASLNYGADAHAWVQRFNHPEHVNRAHPFEWLDALGYPEVKSEIRN